MKTAIIWISTIVVIGLIVWGMIVANRKDGEATPGKLAVAVTNNDHSVGSSSKVTIVEYSDFQCPACESYHSVLKKLINERGEDFTFVYRHFPLSQIHPNAILGSLAAEAANNQGKFWEMHSMLFEHQSEWSTLPGASAEEKLVSYAQTLGLDVSKFSADLKSEASTRKVNDDYKGGARSGVNSTPTFFVNGVTIDNPRSYEEFVTIIERAASSTQSQ
ncbi:MAG: thioredoxin domain-containing protein [Patescibacteria group bacterium]